uniref:DNA binding protein n=1 Tax=Noccaea caerulescens TaxID=107243 RepID=A0A1J3G6W4_NOCCA
MELDLKSCDVGAWKEALSSYESRIESLNKPDLVSLDQFYRVKLPSLLHDRDPNPYLTTSELSQLMKWKLSRGKWRPRLLEFVSSLDDSAVKSASEKAFKSLPDISKAVKELTVLKGVGPATASAVLAAYAPDIAPFMSDEAMEVALGNSKDYSLKRYLLFVTKLQDKAKELKLKGEWDGASDIERALWSVTVRSKSQPEKKRKRQESQNSLGKEDK